MTDVFRQMVDHRFTKAHASEYLDGELPQAERARVEEHASVCPKCRALLASLRRIIEALPGQAAQPWPSVTDAVLAHIRREG